MTFEDPRTTRFEWPTLGLVVVVYAVLAAIVWFHSALPWWLILPVGAYAAALHSSLQHEVLHGHPTRHRRLNEALVFVTPTLWLPYGRYRDTHLAHHRDVDLTDPVRDPESYYMLPDDWAAAGPLKRRLFVFNNTLGGRMLIGPAVSIVQFWSSEWRSICKGNRDIAKAWGWFAAASAITIFYVAGIAAMPVWKYYVLVAYPGVSLALVRSYCEHQAAETLAHRTIVVEASPVWSLLFLNNNLHVAHHSKPALPWYRLPAYYRAERAQLLDRNNNYLMRGYGEMFRRYFFRAKEPVPYPDLNWLRPKDQR